MLYVQSKIGIAEVGPFEEPYLIWRVISWGR